MVYRIFVEKKPGFAQEADVRSRQPQNHPSPFRAKAKGLRAPFLLCGAGSELGLCQCPQGVGLLPIWPLALSPGPAHGQVHSSCLVPN